MSSLEGEMLLHAPSDSPMMAHAVTVPTMISLEAMMMTSFEPLPVEQTVGRIGSANITWMSWVLRGS